jgi:hypothetical protein
MMCIIFRIAVNKKTLDLSRIWSYDLRAKLHFIVGYKLKLPKCIINNVRFVE